MSLPFLSFVIIHFCFFLLLLLPVPLTFKIGNITIRDCGVSALVPGQAVKLNGCLNAETAEVTSSAFRKLKMCFAYDTYFLCPLRKLGLYVTVQVITAIHQAGHPQVFF